MPVIMKYLNREKKSLVLEELQNLSVLNIEKGFKDKIEVKYLNNILKNLYVSTVKIENNGNTSIDKSEVIEPIEINYTKTFIECTVMEKVPVDIGITLETNPTSNSVTCKFDLLNPHEFFTLQFISSDKLNPPKITSRIKGISEINRISLSNDAVPNASKSKLDVQIKYKTISEMVTLVATIIALFVRFI